MNSGYEWSWSTLGQYWPAFRAGAIVTLCLTAVVIVAGTTLGGAAGILLASRKRSLLVPRALAEVVTQVVRALPVLVLLVWMHYVTPAASEWLFTLLKGARNALGSESPSAVFDGISSRAFATACVALSINLAAFVADIIRTAIHSVPRDLSDAALSLGMNPYLRLRRVVGPEAARRSAPALGAMYITMFKFTTLAAFIGCAELMNVVVIAGNQSYRYLELYSILAVVYLIILLPTTWLARRIGRGRISGQLYEG